MAIDNLDWHLSDALAAGRTEEYAFAHIGFFVAWLIRRGLHNPDRFTDDQVRDLRDRSIRGTDLADDIDGKLTSDLLSAEGDALTRASYESYLDVYSRMFEGQPAYSVVEDRSNIDLVGAALDELFAAWDKAGRPPAAHTIGEPEMSGTRRAQWLDPSRGISEEETSHVAPRLESRIPRDLTDPPMVVSSVTAREWRSTRLNRALRKLGLSSGDAVVASAIGGTGESTLAVTLYEVPGAGAEQLAEAFEGVIHRPSKAPWESRQVAGRTVRWGVGKEFTASFWCETQVVVHVAGRASDVEAAIPRLM